MKNRILGKALLGFVINLFTIQAQAQWSQSGNNYTVGNLGIGLQTTYSDFHVEVSGNDLLWPVTVNNSYNASSITNYGIGIKLKHSGNSEHHKWGGIASVQESYWANTSGLALYANETEYVRIKSDGNVGIGTTSPASTLDIMGDNGGVDNRNFRVRYFQTSNQSVGGAELAGIAHVGGNWTAMYAKQGNAKSAAYFDGNVGVGTSSPLSKLHISTNEDAISWNLILNNSRNSSTVSGYGAGIKFKNSGNHEDWKWSGIASVQEGSWSNSTGLVLYADAKESMRIRYNGNVGIGTTTPIEKLEVNGTIRSKEVKVEASPWPDYVFEPEYSLRSLEEIEKFINSAKHLPEVPSSRDVEENGIELGKMNALLLKKIEELTLYTISQEAKIKRLEEANSQENSQLLQRLEKLEEKLKDEE